MSRTAIVAYRAAATIAAVAGVPYLAWRALRHGREVRERLAIGWPAVSGRPVWLHGASVGEVRGVLAVARALAARGDSVVTTAVTPAGVESLAISGVPARFLPLDIPGGPERALARTKPRLLLVFETELWPGLWDAAARSGVPVAVANARLTERALRRYARFAPLVRPLARSAALVAAQSASDAARWLRLGADPAAVCVTGSTKHDVTVDAAGAERVRRRLHGRRIVTAGSTRPGEEEMLLEAWRVAALAPEWLLALAPRHAPRFEDVASLLGRASVAWSRWSAAEDAAGASVLLVDTLGELNAFYAASEIAFVGGSLLPFGGHNVLEPAAAGVPVLFGPHTENAGESPEVLLDAGGAERVSDAAGIAEALVRLAADDRERCGRGAAAREAAVRSTGATDRLLAELARRGLL